MAQDLKNVASQSKGLLQSDELYEVLLPAIDLYCPAFSNAICYSCRKFHYLNLMSVAVYFGD